MKKFITMLLCTAMAISFLCPCVGAQESTPAYDNHDIIKEVAYAYDRHTEILYDQLNARRHIYASPEDATAQRTVYLDCSSYVNSCYREAFGVNAMPIEITSGTTGTAPQTGNFMNYAKNNLTNPDVIGYWENANYTTDAEKQNILAQVRGMLEIGDLLAYRHGKTSDSSGHVYIYVGNDTFLHCYGGGSYSRNESNPIKSYDANESEEANGMISNISANSIFSNTTHSRYLFKETESDTVRNFCLLRPLARGLTPTAETLKRMEIAGVVMGKTASVFENSAVYTGDVITYTVTLRNTTKNVYSDVPLTDVIPAGTEFVSGSEGVSADGANLTWSGDIGANATVTVSYDVRVSATAPGTLIKSDSTYVNGVKLGNITHTLSGYNNVYGLLIGEKAIEYEQNEESFENGLKLVNSLYKSVLGTEIFSQATVGDALADLIDVNNRTSRTDTALSKMIVPNLYGGYDIRYGWLYDPSQNDRSRLISKEELEEGDIILADYSNGSVIYIYIGNSTLITVEDGKCKALTIGDNIYRNTLSDGTYEYPDNILISLLAYNRWAILRPSMVNTASEFSVKSIEIVTPPTKTQYVSGDSFDSTGMVVSAVFSDGSKQEIKGYSVTPEVLNHPQDSVTIAFGGLTATVDVNVSAVLKTISVSEASALDVGTKVKVEGYVVGVACEGDSADKEMLIKDTSEDTIIAVRNIPTSYGTYDNNYGYTRGDKIAFVATVSTDSQYTNKKYLSFSSADNETKTSTIVSSGNEVTYKLDNVVTIDSWTNMQKIYKSTYTPYTYLKITGGSYFYKHSSSVFRLHKNGSATQATDIKFKGGQYYSIRNDVMTPNLGSDWTNLFFDEAETGFPGTYTDKEFYALYIGGNNTYLQLVILDADWVYDSKFDIDELGEDKKSAKINVPTAGAYTAIFADYEAGKLKNIDIVPFSANRTGKVYVNMKKDNFVLEAGDKIMLWDSLAAIKPMCEDLEIK